jgi:hypothetical protein
MPDLPESPTMTDIVRHRFETGQFGQSRFAITPAMREQLLAVKSEPMPYIVPTWPLGGLLGIPFVVDSSLADNVWQLRDSVTGDVLYEGEGVDA